MAEINYRLATICRSFFYADTFSNFTFIRRKRLYAVPLYLTYYLGMCWNHGIMRKKCIQPCRKTGRISLSIGHLAILFIFRNAALYFLRIRTTYCRCFF